MPAFKVYTITLEML